MKTGTKVQVMPNSLSYNGKFSGEIGVIVYVISDDHKRVAVRLENHINNASRFGAYWFVAEELIDYEEKVTEDISMFGNYKRAGVKFLNGANTDVEYQYALYDESVKTGDVVVVKTGHHGFALAKVVTINEEDLNLVSCGREIVSAVDFTSYTARREKAERLQRLKAEMDAKARNLQQVALYEMLAEKDSSMRDLLTEYQSLLV